MDNKIKIAVFGSCVTRDIFNSKFNKDYKKIYECVLTQNQTSVISLMSKPIPLNKDKIDNLNEYDSWNIKTEFTKEFLHLLIEKSPEYIIIDFFADVYFGVLNLNNESFITNNRWKLWKTTYYKELDKNTIKIDSNIEDYLYIWTFYIEKFLKYLNRYLPNAKVIVNKFKFVDNYISDDCGNSTKKISTSGKALKVNVEKVNLILEYLNDYVIKKYNTNYIDMTIKNYKSYEGHPWGIFYVHYTPDYYSDALEKLNKITKNLK